MWPNYVLRSTFLTHEIGLERSWSPFDNARNLSKNMSAKLERQTCWLLFAPFLLRCLQFPGQVEFSRVSDGYSEIELFGKNHSKFNLKWIISEKHKSDKTYQVLILGLAIFRHWINRVIVKSEPKAWILEKNHCLRRPEVREFIC